MNCIIDVCVESSSGIDDVKSFSFPTFSDRDGTSKISHTHTQTHTHTQMPGEGQKEREKDKQTLYQLWSPTQAPSQDPEIMT